MNYHDFLGHVQSRARLGTTGEAARAARATLEILGLRLHGGEAADLAAQLPAEIAVYLTAEDAPSETFGVEEFYTRVSRLEGVDYPDAVHHARSVLSVVREAVSGGEMQDVRAQLPDEYGDLLDADVTDAT